MTITIETGHTLEELHSSEYYDKEECWDFSIEDFWNGSVEPCDDIVYWLIGDRVYETTKEPN